MVSSIANTNSFPELPVHEPRSLTDAPTVKKSRRARAKAAQQKAKETESAEPSTAVPAAANALASSSDDKKKGWQANLTIAEFEALKAEKVIKKHNERFPHKPKVEGTPEPGTVKATQTKDGRPQHHDTRRPNANGSEPRVERPLPPCGILGCPIKADHERREYKFDEPSRPNLIKHLQARGNKTTAGDRKTIARFLYLHKQVKE